MREIRARGGQPDGLYKATGSKPRCAGSLCCHGDQKGRQLNMSRSCLDRVCIMNSSTACLWRTHRNQYWKCGSDLHADLSLFVFSRQLLLCVLWHFLLINSYTMPLFYQDMLIIVICDFYKEHLKWRGQKKFSTCSFSYQMTWLMCNFQYDADLVFVGFFFQIFRYFWFQHNSLYLSRWNPFWHSLPVHLCVDLNFLFFIFFKFAFHHCAFSPPVLLLTSSSVPCLHGDGVSRERLSVGLAANPADALSYPVKEKKKQTTAPVFWPGVCPSKYASCCIPVV